MVLLINSSAYQLATGLLLVLADTAKQMLIPHVLKQLIAKLKTKTK